MKHTLLDNNGNKVSKISIGGGKAKDNKEGIYDFDDAQVAELEAAGYTVSPLGAGTPAPEAGASGGSSGNPPAGDPPAGDPPADPPDADAELVEYEKSLGKKQKAELLDMANSAGVEGAKDMTAPKLVAALVEKKKALSS